MNMDKNQYTSLIALFLIFMLLLLPMDASVAWAASINSVSAYGADEIAGYRAQTDLTVINVSVLSAEDSDLGTGQVKILEDPTRPFECQASDASTSTFVCRAEYPEMPLPLDTVPMGFTVQLFNDGGAPMTPPKQSVLTIDSLPPTVISAEYYPQPGGLVEARFKVEDKACSKPVCSGKCVGILGVKFSVAGLSVGQNDSFGTACLQEGAVNLTGLTLGGEVVTKHLCIEATDKFGQSSNSCKDVMIDTKPPYVSGIGLFDTNGRRISYTNGQPIGNIEVRFNITEDSGIINPHTGNADEVQINASGLSERPEHQAVFGSRPARCGKSGENTYACNSSGFFLIVSTPRTVSIGLEAKDAYDNVLNETKSIPITFDNVGPVATAFSTDFRDDKGVYWVKELNNTISLAVTETGSGMNNRYVFLDFSGFGPQTLVGGAAVNLLASNVCEPGWTCRWNRISTTQPTNTQLTLVPQVGSRDDANNQIVPVTGTFRVDKTSPSIRVINITAMSDMGITNYITSGDVLTVHAYIEDHTPVRAIANFSRIMADASFSSAEATCSEFAPTDENVSAYVEQYRSDRSARVWDCQWEVGPILEVPRTINHPWTNTSAIFNVTDLLGYSSSEEHTVTILGEENVTADYWHYDKDSWSQSPEKGLDRFIWGLGQPVSFQRFKIRPWDEGLATILSFDFDATTCVGDIDYLYYTDSGNAGATYMAFSEVTENGVDDVIMLEFNAGNAPPATWADENNDTYPLDDLYINCTATIRSIVEGARVSMLEQENITLKVSLYGNPLGQNIGNVKDEIDRIEGVVGSDWWGIIKYPKIVLDYAKIVCDLLNTVNQLRALWEAVSDGLGAACETTGELCGASGSANQAQGEMNNRVRGLMGKLNSFCGLVISCRATTPSSHGNVTMTTDEEGNQEPECTDSDDGWCRVMVAWSNWNNKVINALSGSWAGSDEGRALETTQVDRGGTVTTEMAGGFNAFRGNESGTISFADKSALRGSFDVKKSLISSLITACLPGIFAGIDKYRQLMCEWLLCYKVNIAYGSMTMTQCDSLLYYGICKYVLGEVWNIVPFYQYANELTGLFKDVLGDPFMLIGYAVDIICSNLCASTPGSGCSVCTAIEFINVGSQIAASIATFANGEFWSAPMHDMCEEALKDEPSYSNLAGFPPEADPATQPPEGGETAPTEIDTEAPAAE